MKKGNKIYSIINFKCPHCHEGQFLVSTPYDLRTVGDVRDECPVCHIKYAKEPGFYYGAMYVSYALGVALFVTVWASCNWFFRRRFSLASNWTRCFIFNTIRPLSVRVIQNYLG